LHTLEGTIVWVKIPADKLPHLRLFGYDFIQKGADGLDWYHGPNGRTAVDPADPTVWVEDEGEAMQLGAKAIHIHSDDE
jgi:hypothetical protein